MRKTTAIFVIVLSGFHAFAYAQRPVATKEAPGLQPVNRTYTERNFLRIAPITAGDGGVGFGLSYERLLDQDRMIGLTLPVSMYFDDGYSYGFTNNSRTGVSFYTAPGIKIYPFGQRRVTYAVGPSVFAGYGRTTGVVIYTPVNPGVIGDASKLRLGVLVNNYLNINLSSKLTFGIEGGFGIRYLEREYYRMPGETFRWGNGINPTGHAAMTFGLRF